MGYLQLIADISEPAGWHDRRMATSPVPVPAVPRPAATVALVRDGREGLEVYLLRRVQEMAFAGGMHVFPGGSVDPADSAPPAWVGPEPGWWAVALGVDQAMARALVVAAVRETFEECGVLLAGPSPSSMVDDVSGPEWEAERSTLEAGGHSLAGLLERRRLRLRADLLAPVAHWITPEAAPKRFDTHFFVAALPAAQQARTAGTEADVRLWIRPEQALSTGLRLMPPTIAVLTDLAEHADVAAALTAERTIVTVQPWVDRHGQIHPTGSSSDAQRR
jgi:8-oxo-dGTP pyrophosphatase MutT (NUDIX family)